MIVRWFVLFSMVTVGEGCQSGPVASDPEPIVIGAVYNLTGSRSALDVPSARGARLAVAEANQAGGIRGRRVQLIVADGESDPGILAERTAELLGQDPAPVALLGLSDADMVLAAAPVAAKAGRLFLTSGATSPRLPEQVPATLFLACFGDNVQAAAAAEWAVSHLKAGSATVVYDRTRSDTTRLRGYFQSRFEELGGLVDTTVPYGPSELPSFERGPGASDFIFLAAGSDEAVEVVRRIRAAGITSPILGGDGLDRGEWPEAAWVSDVYFTTHADLTTENPRKSVQRFVESFESAYPGSTPDAFAALGYDAVWLLLGAIGTADRLDAAAIPASLARLPRFSGLTGEMRYDEGRRIPSKSVHIVALDQGLRRRPSESEIVPRQVPVP